MVWKLSSSHSRESSILKAHSNPQQVASTTDQLREMFSLPRIPYCLYLALSVRPIESVDRKRGSRICLEFPCLSLRPCRSPITACLALKLTIQISLRVLDYDSRCWRWGDGHAHRPRYLANVRYPLWRNELDIASIIRRTSDARPVRDSAHFLKKDNRYDMPWYGTIIDTVSENSI